MRLRASGVLLLLAALASATPGAAQVRPRRPPLPRVTPKKPPKVVRPPADPSTAPTSLRARQGQASAARAIQSAAPEERVRGFERLGEVGTPAAMDLLARSLEPGGAARTFEDRLTVVRALATRATDDVPRQALARAMSSAAAGRADEAGETLVRDTAALALARSAHPQALEILGKALRQEGPVAASAARALVAHPPRDLGPILSARGAPTRALIEVLEALGDQRAFGALRSWVKHGAPEVRGRAALALTRLGDYETVELARHWLGRPERDPALIAAATRILLLARAPDAGRAVSSVLRREPASELAMELLGTSRSEELLPLLARRLGDADDGSAPFLLGAIGRIGSAEAAAVLARELAHPRRGAAAAYALSTCPGRAARAHVEAALGARATRRHAARAAVIREAVLGEAASGLDAALAALLDSRDDADRAAAAWGLAVRDPAAARRLIGHADPVIARAAARAALDERAADAAADRLATEGDAVTRAALAIALAREASAQRVPTRVVIELIDAGGSAAAVAARALAARDGERERPQVERLARSGDPLIRAHVALGLADSREPSAVGVLRDMYRFEQDADVRHAIVVALSRRDERPRERTLELAASLDGDERVRSAARLALKGARLSPLPRGRGALWMTVVDTDGGKAARAQARLGTASGLALPVVADPDGAVVVIGLPEGPVSLRLAAATDLGHAP